MTHVAPIVTEAVLAASPEALFDAFTDPRRLCDWFAQEASIDLRPGGAWRFGWPGGMAAEGRVVAAERPGRYEWTWERSVTGTQDLRSDVRLRYSFTREQDGGGQAVTRMRIEESGHETAAIRDMNATGINQMLATLRAYVEHGTTIDWTATP